MEQKVPNGRILERRIRLQASLRKKQQKPGPEEIEDKSKVNGETELKEYDDENLRCNTAIESLVNEAISDVAKHKTRSEAAADTIVPKQDADSMQSEEKSAKEDDHVMEIVSLLGETIGKKNSLAVDVRKNVLPLLRDLRAVTCEKKNLIDELKRKLIFKEGNFEELLQKQNNDSRNVFETIQAYGSKVIMSQRLEIRNLLASFEKYRLSFLENATHDIGKKFDKRINSELDSAANKVSSTILNEAEVSSLKQIEEEDFEQTKKVLEQDLQHLEQVLENVKATILLNVEKLDYNHKVLSEREEENAKLLNSQKRRLTRLKDSLTRNISKFNEQNLKFVQRNSDLAEDFRNISLQQSDLERKFSQFEKMDLQYWKDISNMRDEEINELLFEVQQMRQLFISKYKLFSMNSSSTSSNFEKNDQLAEENICELSEEGTKVEVQEALTTIAKCLSFLVDENSEGAPQEQVVLAALGIGTEDETQRFVSHMLEKPETLNNPFSALKAVRNFLKASKWETRKNTPKETVSGASGDLVNLDKDLRLWTETEEKLGRHYRILKKRRATQTNRNQLHKENVIMKGEIQNRLSETSLRQLLVPPVQALF